jgi:hypothetical protein
VHVKQEGAVGQGVQVQVKQEGGAAQTPAQTAGAGLPPGAQ